MECAELAPAFGTSQPLESAGKPDTLQSLREIGRPGLAVSQVKPVASQNKGRRASEPTEARERDLALSEGTGDDPRGSAELISSSPSRRVEQDENSDSHADCGKGGWFWNFDRIKGKARWNARCASKRNERR